MRPPQPLAFWVPEVSITISHADVEPILEELDELARFDPGPVSDYADAAALMRKAQAEGMPALGLDLPPGPDVGLLRALDHLRYGGPGRFGRDLSRLRDALLGKVAASTVTYELELRRADGSVERKTFFAYSGRYDVGERLPVPKSGECWMVVEIQREPHGKDRLICEPCQESG